MLHLHCLVWLQDTFHIAELRHRVLSQPDYADRVVKLIDRIIKYSILPNERTDPVNTNASLASLNETDFA